MDIGGIDLVLSGPISQLVVDFIFREMRTRWMHGVVLLADDAGPPNPLQFSAPLWTPTAELLVWEDLSSYSYTENDADALPKNMLHFLFDNDGLTIVHDEDTRSLAEELKTALCRDFGLTYESRDSVSSC